MEPEYDLIVVGAGFFGLTIAERAASDVNASVLVVERRSHIGGNAYSARDPDMGIEIHQYGSHLFHTSNTTVWNYINRFSAFTNYQHRVFTTHRNRVYSMPINLQTINQFFGSALSPEQAKQLIASQVGELAGQRPRNLEEKAISLIGRPLYEAFIRDYTAKQWETDPRHLPPSTISRLPVRFNYDNRYFSDRFEGLPVDGYGELFRRMTRHPGITIQTDADYFEVRRDIDPSILVVYTGPIDRYFDYDAGELNWRTLEFERSVFDTPDFQGTAVMNFADIEVPYTRIHEFRHLHPEREYPIDRSVVYTEYSRLATREDEPYYPVNSWQDRELLATYRTRVRQERNVIFGGRLGSYQYLDMHMAIASALSTYQTAVRPRLQRAARRRSGLLRSRETDPVDRPVREGEVA